MKRRLPRAVAPVLLALGVVFVAAGGAGSAASGAAGEVVLVEADSIIQPVVAEFLRDAIDEADDAGAAALVIRLSTPGGLLTSTREIFTDMLSSEVPVVVYVSPSGAQAASAGFFLLMAADVAAMAPGTNTGAAAPVGGQGEEIEGKMGEKVEQDAAATIRSLASRNGRDQTLAEAAVIEARSFTAEEALENGLIDLMADDLGDLLAALDGFDLARGDGEPRPLRTAGAVVRTVQMNAFQRFLSAVAHPNIAYILLTLGGLGLYFELSNPGAILPGVIGGICLILAFFALSVLPVSYAGIALILLAMLFFIAEVKVTSYGILSIAGVVSLVLGSLMLFKSPDPAIRVSVDVILIVVVFTLVVVSFLMIMVLKAHRSQVKTGAEGLLNRLAVAKSEIDPEGKIFLHGELWHAVAERPIAAGQRVRVVAVEDGMTLRVQPEGEPPAEVETEERSLL
ncbi:MAG: nodulation protein NfeD [Thermoanaerobaculia bacterium]|nr:nodulation protein NfeD [Thermoanaerobaculia bacterium]